MIMTILALEQVSRSYQPAREALRSLDLSVESGDVLGVIGRSGAGKTTLLRIAAGLLKADRGQVRVFGVNPWEHPVEVKRRVGYVAESQAVPAHFSVRALL